MVTSEPESRTACSLAPSWVPLSYMMASLSLVFFESLVKVSEEKMSILSIFLLPCLSKFWMKSLTFNFHELIIYDISGMAT